MKKPDLYTERPEDSEIGGLKTNKGESYRIINGRKVYQLKEENDYNKDINIITNRIIASKLSPSEYIRTIYDCD